MFQARLAAACENFKGLDCLVDVEMHSTPVQDLEGALQQISEFVASPANC
jgi:hypothetical protein